MKQLESLNVPTLPQVVARLQAMVEDHDVGIREIAVVVAEDAPIAAKVLRVANSSFYGLQEPATTIEHATTVLGTQVLHSIVLQTAIIKEYEHLSRLEFDIDSIWRHCIVTAQISQVLARVRQRDLDLPAGAYYSCGLLHDIGKIALLDNLGEEYVTILTEARQQGRHDHEAEKDALGYNHCRVGGIVATRWGLPNEAVQVIKLHHGPHDYIESNSAVALIVLADQFANEVLGLPMPGVQSASRAATALSLSASQMEDIKESARERLPDVLV